MGHEKHANRMKCVSCRHGRQPIGFRQDGLETTLHIGPVIAIPDRLIETAKLIGMGYHRTRDGDNQGASFVPLHVSSRNSGLNRVLPCDRKRQVGTVRRRDLHGDCH